MSKIPRRRQPASGPVAADDALERERLAAHRGHATWGERLVPLDEFRRAAAAAGPELGDRERQMAREKFTAPHFDGVAAEGPFSRVVVCGGIYNNHQALAALLEEASAWGAEAIYCLGDFGGFGPNPEKIRPLLRQGAVRSIAGNYELSLAALREDCDCGYADPRDNHFAELSYRYTQRHVSAEFRREMGALPKRRRVLLGEAGDVTEALLVHGSPRLVNEFLFDSTTSDAFLDFAMRQERCDALLCTHTGLPWRRQLPSGRLAVNVGVIGRPANDGRTEVWYLRLTAERGGLQASPVALRYDYQALAREMRQEDLPKEFVETIETGWWTTCLEILPAKERSRSRY